MTKMKACGIVAEYNPFHNGHQYHIEQTRKQVEADVIVAVMSGNWVQRGEPAIIDKWTRAKAAIEQGVDLVIELPFIYATQSATQFAHGAIHILKASQINYLSFGSECGNLDNLLEIASTPINPDRLQTALKSGMSYPRSYSLLTTTMCPNDLLGVCYLKELQDSDIQPILIPRENEYHSEELEEVCSATAIRKALSNKEDVSFATPMTLDPNDELAFMKDYYEYFRMLILTTPKERLQETFMIQEGIENHLIKHASQCQEYDSFINHATTWRYTASRIRRSMLHLMMQTQKETINSLKDYDTLRILAFNETGQHYLHELKKEAVHIANRFAEIPQPYKDMEYRSTLLYTLPFSKERQAQLLQQEIGGPLRITHPAQTSHE